jgi:hypothetical protein
MFFLVITLNYFDDTYSMIKAFTKDVGNEIRDVLTMEYQHYEMKTSILMI